ncbi:hypothetical protein IAT38_006712 [Cryptococcus sp. DSM 104549]
MVMAVPHAPAASPTASFFPTQPTSSTSPTSTFVTPTRKRRAASPSPLEEAPVSPWAPPTTSPTSAYDATVHREKRRRPNLANGFSGLSISQTGQSNVRLDNGMGESQETYDAGDEGLGPSSYPTNKDVRVEVLPEPSARSRHHHHSTLHHWSVPNHAGPSSSSSSTSPNTSGEDNYDSDVTFTRQLPRARRYAGVAQQADEIVQPDVQPVGDAELGVEDVTSMPRLSSGRRPREEEDDLWSREGKRRRGNDMDVDMDMGGDDNANVDEIPRSSEDKARGRKTVWYEPEKDRIVITSLSDTSSTPSRSPSPESTKDRLSQPGVQGFTISPSLLTHLLQAQRDLNTHGSLESMIKKAERSLTLYRPPGSAPGALPDAIVKAWQGEPQLLYEDSGRFEEVNDDEDMAGDGSDMALDMDSAMGVESGGPPAATAWDKPAWDQDLNAQVMDGDVDMVVD